MILKIVIHMRLVSQYLLTVFICGIEKYMVFRRRICYYVHTIGRITLAWKWVVFSCMFKLLCESHCQHPCISFIVSNSILLHLMKDSSDFSRNTTWEVLKTSNLSVSIVAISGTLTFHQSIILFLNIEPWLLLVDPIGL